MLGAIAARLDPRLAEGVGKKECLPVSGQIVPLRPLTSSRLHRERR